MLSLLLPLFALFCFFILALLMLGPRSGFGLSRLSFHAVSVLLNSFIVSVVNYVLQAWEPGSSSLSLHPLPALVMGCWGGLGMLLH